MYDKLMKWSGLVGITVMLLAICSMIFYAEVKPLVYVQATESSYTTDESMQLTEQLSLIQLIPEEKKNLEGLYIPLGGQTTKDEISIENNHQEQRITIRIAGMDASIYDEETVYGDTKELSRVQAGTSKSGLLILIDMNHLYEYEAVLENQKLHLTFQRPSQLYDRIVVLDAGGGGAENGVRGNGIAEDTYCLELMNRVKELLEADQIGVYCTRQTDTAVSVEKRIQLTREAQADLMVSLHLETGSDYGIEASYNERYFTQYLTSAELAGALVTETATAVQNRGTAKPMEYELLQDTFQGDEEDYLLYMTQIPAARLSVGHPENLAEATLLKREDYQEQLAEGIYQAIVQCLELKYTR